MCRAPCRPALLVAGVAAMLAAACGGDESPDGGGAGGGPADTACPPGESTHDAGGCCPAGSVPGAEGSCQPAGVPATACAEGFVAREGGCDPVLPPGVCPAGELGVPGEETCQSLGSCGAGPWGDIPVEAGTVYVDAAYAGADSDGSAAKPWTTVQAGIDAAGPGAMVAVAAGGYLEDIRIQDKSVRLWGRCPGMVTITGTGAESNAVLVLWGADGTLLRGFAVDGQAGGIGVAGSQQVELRNLWIHDLPGRGLTVQDDFGETGAMVQRVLVERATEIGAFVWGSEVTFDEVGIRESVPLSSGSGGVGLVVMVNPATGRRADVEVRRSLFEQNRGHGLFVEGADLALHGVAVRDVVPGDATSGGGAGVAAEVQPDTGQRPWLSVSGSVIESSTQVGLVTQGADVAIDTTTLRDTRPLPDGTRGMGIAVQGDVAMNVRGVGAIRQSLIERVHEVGVFVTGSDVTVESVWIRDVGPQQADQQLGRGLALQINTATNQRVSGLVRGSTIERVHDVGVIVDSSDVTIESTLVRDIMAQQSDGDVGRGLQIQLYPPTAARADVTVRDSLVERTREAAIMVTGSDAAIESTLVRDTLVRDRDGLFGDGVVVIDGLGEESFAALTRLRVERSPRAGIVAFGCSVDLGMSWLICNALPLAAQRHGGLDPLFADLGGNQCSCDGVDEPCQVRSADLVPPEPLD